MAPCRFIDKGHLLDRSGFEVIAAFRQKGQAILDNVYERVEDEFGLLDPDAPGNWTLEEFQDLYCCLKQKLGDRFAEVDPALKDFYRDILLDPMRPGELITVPTGSCSLKLCPVNIPCSRTSRHCTGLSMSRRPKPKYAGSSLKTRGTPPGC
jgi:hypothetical protein